jgi:hypothetical protein
VSFSKHGVDEDVHFSWATIPNDNMLLLLFEPNRRCGQVCHDLGANGVVMGGRAGRWVVFAFYNRLVYQISAL